MDYSAGWADRWGAGDTITQAMVDAARRIEPDPYGLDVSVRESPGLGTPWGRLLVHSNQIGWDSPNPAEETFSYWLSDERPNGYSIITPLTPAGDGTYTRGTPFKELDNSFVEDGLPVVGMMAAPFAAAIGATAAAGAGTGAAAGGAAGGSIAGGSGLTLGGTGAMTAGEALGAAGGSGLSLGGSSLGTSLGAAGGSGLSLGGVTAGTTSALGGTLGASLSGLGDSTLSDAILNGATNGGTGAAHGGSTWGSGGSSVPSTPSTPSTGGLSSSDSAVLHSNEGYGPGMTGAQNAAYNTVADLTGNQQLASLAGDAAGLPGVGGLTDAASWLRNNPTLGRLLFSAGSSLLSSAGGGSGGGSGAAAESYGPAKQWTSALQRGLYQQPQQVSLPTTLAGQLGLNGAARWVR